MNQGNPEPTVWAFDLGKASIGEAVRVGNEFKHKASLLIPAEFAETRTARGDDVHGNLPRLSPGGRQN